MLEFKCHVKRIDFKSARLCLLALIRVCAHSAFSINATEKSNYSFPRNDLRNSYTSAVFTPSPNHLYFYFPLNRMYLSLNRFCQSRSQSSIKFVNMKVFLAIKRNASSTCGFLVSICHVDLQVNSAFLESVSSPHTHACARVVLVKLYICHISTQVNYLELYLNDKIIEFLTFFPTALGRYFPQ